MYQRILHLIHTPRFSGAEILVRDLCLIHQKKGISTAIASIAPTEADFEATMSTLKQAGVTTFIPSQGLQRFQRSRFYRGAMKAFSPDVVYAHSVIPALWGRMALPLAKRAKFISVLHSTDDYQGRAFHLSEIPMALRADSVFTVSEVSAQNYRKRIPIPPTISVVPNGTNVANILKALNKREETRRVLGLTASDRMLLQVGRISTTKQQLFSLDACADLLSADRSLKLYFAGLNQQADYQIGLEAKIRALGLGNQVKLLGGREDVPELLAAADVYLMPSLNESQGIAMIEALASGVPVVASDIPAFQYARALPSVTLVDPTDKAAMTEAVRQALKSGGRSERDMSAFDMENVAAVYGGYVAGSGPVRSECQ
jgi:glycosyltransferase involved in cell wall biosynthesis